MRISLIVTTYNQLPALQAVIQSLKKNIDWIASKTPRNDDAYEIIIADDGSTEETGEWIRQQKHLIHVWQPDTGFNAAQIRNRAAAKATGDYLIFLDGDCIAPRYFIQHHRQLAQPGCFVTGNRVLLSHAFTQHVLAQKLPISQWTYRQWLWAYVQKKCNRVLPFFPLLRGLFPWRYSSRWQGAKTCNLSLWRTDFIAVNGFDERYQGWGYEDSDLVVRLMRHGIRRKHARFSIPVLHLWHAENDRSKEAENRLALKAVMAGKNVVAQVGVGQYL